MRSINIGVRLHPRGPREYAVWRDTVKRVEDLGVDIIFGNDQVQHPTVRMVDGGFTEMLSDTNNLNRFHGWATLASWGEITTRVQIGLFVEGIGYRNVDELADMARTVDSISRGRLIFGIGNHGPAQVVSRYGKDYSQYRGDTTASQMRRSEAALQYLERRLSKEVSPDANSIPIIMTGSGSPGVMRLISRYAQTWHSALDLDAFRRSSAVLDHMTDELQRTRVTRSASWTGPAQADRLVAEGVSTFIADICPKSDRHDLSVVEDMIRWRQTADRRDDAG